MTLKELAEAQSPFYLSIQSDGYLAGTRRAVWDKHVLHVSPAMFALLCDPDSIDLVAAAIEVVVIPRLKDWLPMTSLPSE